MRAINLDVWNADQADTQFQGEGSSHELAAILLTECIQHSLYVAKKPLFALYLDAKSAFDNVLRHILIRNLFICGTSPGSINFINNRLDSRKTMVDWDKHLMGPINDGKGVEQGGANSSDYYKIFGKPQLDLAQSSNLGVSLPGNVTISAIGQADDTILTSNNIHALQCLLQLTLHFCAKYNVELCVEKTKLQVFATSDLGPTIDHLMDTSPVNIKGEYIDFVNYKELGAEHVGIVRCSSGNLPHILSRLTSHKNRMAAVMHTGIGRGHRANPVASLRIETLYGTSVLLSGLGALVLKKADIDIVDAHQNQTINNILRLHDKTPHCVTAFLAGSLPGTALVHLRILSNFGMISRNPDGILYKLGLEFFSTRKSSSRSWFSQVRDICLLYQLPHPLHFMKNSQSKESFKNQAKKSSCILLGIQA